MTMLDIKPWDSTPTGTHTTCLHMYMIVPVGVLDPARSAAAARLDAATPRCRPSQQWHFLKVSDGFPKSFRKVSQEFSKRFQKIVKVSNGFPKLLSNVRKAFQIYSGAPLPNPKFSTQTFVGIFYNCSSFWVGNTPPKYYFYTAAAVYLVQHPALPNPKFSTQTFVGIFTTVLFFWCATHLQSITFI